MNPPGIRIAGTGIICALGGNGAEILHAVAEGRSGLGPLTRFTVPQQPVPPVGQAPELTSDPHLPQTVYLARIASDQAMASTCAAPDAIVIGVTTGGMAITEDLLKGGCTDPAAYRLHGIDSAAKDLARRYHCRGPVLTVSTACSSGGCAIALASALIASGRYRRVLTGGTDSLCRLTYYGFKSLQLIDPQGARPLDRDRRGMSIAEGAGMLLLEAADKPGEGIEILGAGLSCDAHHPVQPHPEGRGALSAMRAALSQAELGIEEIDYINLHGTGTPENDRSEAAAVNILFDGVPPPVSSLKGATGHSLAASGAIEAVIAALCIENELIPANTGCRIPDPALKLTPVDRPTRKPIRTVLSNSFGFGGNNASVIIGRRHDRAKTALGKPAEAHPFRAVSWSAVTGAGLTDEALQRFSQGRSCKGRIDSRRLCRGLPAGMIRRIKRLSQMGLALLADMKIPGGAPGPKSIFFGTGWGSLSETHDFLQGLFDSGERFSSPTDFIGSVHNAPSGQIALAAQSTGANVTLSGGDHSFEQALFSAQMLVTDSDPVMVLGADETHDRLSLLFDLSAAADPVLSDGGGALILRRTPDPVGPTVTLKYFETDFENRPDPQELVLQLGGAERICSKYRLIMAGLPAAERAECRRQLGRFMALSGFKGGILEYRSLTGEFATSAAVAVVFAVSMVHSGLIPLPFRNGAGGDPQAGSVLLLGLGSALTAIEVGPL